MESDVPCKMKIYNRTGSKVRLVFCVLVIAFTGCKSKIEFHESNSAKASASATSLKPITAKPGDIVSLTGTGFSARQKNLVKITTAEN